MIPNYIQAGIQFDSITSVIPRYDASEIFALASGISWILILTFTSTLFSPSQDYLVWWKKDGVDLETEYTG